MLIEEYVLIQAAREDVWRVITDIDHAVKRIEGIEAIEILERPPSGLVGLKWRETRTLFGKTATEVMWISEAEENERYRTLAQSHGADYKTDLVLADEDGGTRLTMRFTGEPKGLWARLMAALLGWMIIGATRKVVVQDLQDIKAAVEEAGPAPE